MGSSMGRLFVLRLPIQSEVFCSTCVIESRIRVLNERSRTSRAEPDSHPRNSTRWALRRFRAMSAGADRRAQGRDVSKFSGNPHRTEKPTRMPPTKSITSWAGPRGKRTSGAGASSKSQRQTASSENTRGRLAAEFRAWKISAFTFAHARIGAALRNRCWH